MKRDLIIIGSEHFDATTDFVMNWLNYYGERVIRVNLEDKISIHSLLLTGEEFDFEVCFSNGIAFRLSEIKSFWLRRSGFNLQRKIVKFGRQEQLTTTEGSVNKHLLKEIGKVEDFLEYIFINIKGIKSVGANSNRSTNKLTNLYAAKEVGLLIPGTYIFSSKKEVSELLNKEVKLITKTISDLNPIQYEIDEKKYHYVLYTNIVTHSTLDLFPETFAPSLFQQYIEKKVELRIFYFAGKVFPMAIFSQLDTQTEVDFRRYNQSRPNKNSLFKLPQRIEDQLIAFMKSINLDSGSIDMIYTPDNNYFFLEVNPVGQFGMVSSPCNYYIEKFIAEYLK
jgi:ATP-GRASP peptide maturase of grasp-with-spasm system